MADERRPDKAAASPRDPSPAAEGPSPLAAGPTDPAEIERRLVAVLELVPEARRREAMEVVHQISASFSYQGPMPPPAMLRGYEDVVPGAAERILALTEREQAHRHAWEGRALRLDGLYAILGLGAGWTTALALAGGATLTGIYGSWQVGVALAAASATGMVWKLVQGRSREDRPPPKTAAADARRPRGAKPKRR